MGKEKKFLHLMMDERFIDYFITQSEEVKPGGSVYWVAQKQTKELKHTKSPLIKQVKWTKQTIPFLAKEANQYDKLVLHSFFFDQLESFLKSLRKDTEVIWMFWGGDGYKFTPAEKRWYLPLTWQYKKNVLKKDIGTARSIVRELNAFRLRWIKSRATCALIRRVSICATWVKYDYEMIRHLNTKMKWTYYSYFTAEQMALATLGPQTLNVNRLWLGNSATDTNNHLDALHYLKGIGWKGDIVVPLSYGGKDYAQNIIAYGKQYFAEKFIPITELMPLDQYQQYINSCGIVWMNHIRQQAAGNTLAALYMGKAVIMNSNNNLYKTLKDWGVRFAEKSVLENVENIKGELFNHNRLIIEANLSQKENLVAVAKIYS
ncbi:TDP-N-acetylfucosamine:lipid II N-acetylfucosaminyltransferase [Agriterribacter humi]|uniref:TDP-N-acetylfucosamine:lipid II N-acetylfucosaminyltransferase n=1 Tax=Agriterribacter humi TaxID=1104781 RepID=UPI001264A821|nr:TDP-N-acetylfucosamine:lipid II N-acetylfucosaminyltransferase [Agriterribacter humi]